MCHVDACRFVGALQFAVTFSGQHKGFDDWSFWDFEEENVKLLVNMYILGLVGTGHYADFVTISKQFIAQIVDVAACSTCKWPIFGGNEAYAPVQTVFLRLPNR